MNITSLLKNRKKKSELMINKYNLTGSNKIFGLIDINNEDLNNEIIPGLNSLSVNFLIKGNGITNSNISYHDNINIDGFDFIVTDNLDMISPAISKGIIPIVSSDIAKNNNLIEYNPSKSVGNSYIYNNTNKWEVFHAIIRYLENHKFPYDNKALIKNVLES